MRPSCNCPVSRRRSGAPRYAQRHGHCARFEPEHRSHRRHRLCGRDQEIGVLAAQFPCPAARYPPDALFGQCRRGWRHRFVLRPQRHRQDDAQLRSVTTADRRRRAFVEPGWHRQYRGRLLCQDGEAQRGGRARDFCRGAKLWHGARKRRPHLAAIPTSPISASPRTPAPPIRSRPSPRSCPAAPARRPAP